MSTMNFMYKCVDLNSDIHLGYIIFCLYHLYIIKKCFEFSLLNDNFIIIFREKPNRFQQFFVTINYFCLIIINATILQIVFSERKCKRNITVKNPLTNNYNTMVDPAKKIFQLD